MTVSTLYQHLKSLPSSTRMPVVFLGHGSPMNAIEDNSFSSSWRTLGENLPTPSAILCLSAHWMTQGEVRVLSSGTPRTIHDFYGFPQALFDQQYPAPGAPDQALITRELLQPHTVMPDTAWGFDHGTWSVLLSMYPAANIPVYQLSIDMRMSPEQHYAMAERLTPLRDRGVLIMGSGNVVHNLGAVKWENDAPAYDWALDFDQLVADAVASGNHAALTKFDDTATLMNIAHPSIDHYLPLLYPLACSDDKDKVFQFNEVIDLASISMRSMVLTP